MNLLRTIRTDEGGAAAPMVALILFGLICFAALCIDGGSMFLYSRKLQGAADLAAVSAANRIDASRATQATATAAAREVAQENMGASVQTEVVFGAYTPDRSIPPPRRFDPAAATPNAVQVTLRGGAPVFFAGLFLNRDTITVRRTARAAQTRLAAFSIGTRLLAVDGGVANAALSALTGSQVKLSVSDYNALATAQVDVLRWNRALGQRMGVTAGSYNDVLEAHTSAGDSLAAAADALDQSDSQAKRALQALSAAARNKPIAHLSDLIDLGPMGDRDETTGLDARVSALSLATGVLEVSNGDRQVRFALDADVGLAKTDVWLAIGERPNQSPWLTVTDHGEPVIRTAQARLYLTARATAPLGLGALNVPIYAETATGEARLASIQCGDAPAVTLDVRPGVGAVSIGEVDTTKLDDFKHPIEVRRATLLSALIVEVKAQARAQLGGDHWQQARFTRADIEGGAVRTVTTDDIAQALVAHLIEDLQLEVAVKGLGGLALGKTAVQTAVGQTLRQIARPLDAQLNAISALSGVRLGQADVQVGGVRCGGGTLIG